MTGNPPSPGRILEIASGYWATGLLGVATEHSLFTLVHNGLDTAGRLAAKAGMAERGAQTLLDGLVGLGLVETARRHLPQHRRKRPVPGRGPAHRPQRLRQAQAGRDGQTGEPARGLPRRRARWRTRWSRWPTTRTGRRWSRPSPRIRSPPRGPPPSAEAWPSAGDLGSSTWVAGRASSRAVWLRLNPAARATQLDWGPINAIARRLLARARPWPTGSPASTATSTRTDSTPGLRHRRCTPTSRTRRGRRTTWRSSPRSADALKPGGTLVVCDYVVEDDRSGPSFPLLFASEMLLKSTKGATWRRADYAAWLAEAGFKDVEFHDTSSPTTLIFAR